MRHCWRQFAASSLGSPIRESQHRRTTCTCLIYTGKPYHPALVNSLKTQLAQLQAPWTRDRRPTNNSSYKHHLNICTLSSLDSCPELPASAFFCLTAPLKVCSDARGSCTGLPLLNCDSSSSSSSSSSPKVSSAATQNTQMCF